MAAASRLTGAGASVDAPDASVALELFPLFRTICGRLAQAADDPYSLQERDPEAEAAATAAKAKEREKLAQAQATQKDAQPQFAPVMVGMEEDADLSTWDMMDFEQHAPGAQSRPTQLQEDLVTLSQRLKKLVLDTHYVADTLPGGQWSVHQQRQLLHLLESQERRQRCVGLR